uniref:Ku domain-containing protein n=1 Tax=Panagrolaimus davidi TaxID=227884 RepID=A0A914Q6B3_9BILA
MTSTDNKIVADGGRQGTIFCIDSADYMFEVNDNDEEKRTHMLIALKAMRTELNMKAVSGDLREMVGIIFFNTAKTNPGAEGLDNIYVYRKMVEYDDNQFMKGLDADLVKQVDGLIKDETTREKFFKDLGHGECDYSQLVWLIERNFQYDLKAQKKAAFVFSRNQFMSDYSQALIEKVKIELDKAEVAGIQITHMLLGEDEAAEHWLSLNADIDVFDSAAKLTDGIKRKNVSRRSTTTIPLNLGNDISLTVSIFHLVKKQELETGVYLNEKTMNIVKSKTRHVKQPTMSDTMSLSRIIEDEKSGAMVKRETVDISRIKLKNRIGGMDLEMTKAEFENFKRIDHPGLTIIGFKPMSCLKQSHYIGPSHYLFPKDEVINGSACLYRALHSRCLTRNVFILARYVLKTNTMPKLVALVPQRKGAPESNETDVEHEFYEGFHVVIIQCQQMLK